jgi:hypothetical protein
VVLRGMLLEQKRECATLHANALFFWQKSKQPQAGPPPVIDDLEAGACVLVCMCVCAVVSASIASC